jgi:hypothetical protein
MNLSHICSTVQICPIFFSSLLRSPGANVFLPCSDAKMMKTVLVFWIPGYPGPPAPGPLQRPNFGPGVERRLKPAEKTLMKRRLMRRTTTKTTKDQKASSRAVSREGRDHVHVSSARFHAEQEDKDRRPLTVHATLDREETNFHHACIKRHSGCWPPS